MSKLILPGDALFDFTLSQSLPPNWNAISNQNGGQCAFVVRLDTGIMEAVSDPDLDEYLYGGEYIERVEQVGATEAAS